MRKFSAANSDSDPQWTRLLTEAGVEHKGFTLDGIISPSSPNAVHLVVSVTCVRNRNVHNSTQDDKLRTRTIKLGRVPSNYRVFVYDARGKAVSMTSFGREFFVRQIEEHSCEVAIGCSVGTWLPLDELFPLKSNERYMVIVMLPDEPGSLTGLVSLPLNIHVPALPIAGETRPLYGSDQLWAKLVDRVPNRNPEYDIEWKVIRSSDPFESDDPRIVLSSRSVRSLAAARGSAKVTLLVRDMRGKPVFTMRRDVGDTETADLSCGTVKTSDASPFEPVGGKAAAGGRSVAAYPAFPGSFPIIPGEPYTVLAAVRIKGDHPSFVVARPFTYVPRFGGDFRANKESDSHIQPSQDMFAAVAPLDSRWDELARFADRPFEGLHLTASARKPDVLMLSLGNQSKRPIIVKKWEGAGGYNVQLRNSDGKTVSLTEKGKRFFDGGSAIDTRELQPKETIEQSIPLSELFDMKTPGEYCVLASLPVIGDVDAVLTAAPVKIRIGQQPAAPGK